MDSTKIEKINALKKYKRDQLLKNLFLYSMTGLACLFYSTPFWLPTITSSMEVLFFVYVPKLKSIFFSSKFVFILGNLIIVALIGESKIFSSSSHTSSSPSDQAYFEEYMNRKRSLQKFSPPQEKKKFEENCCYIIEETKRSTICEDHYKAKDLVHEYRDRDRDVGVTLPSEDLKKRADDFIARVNKQRIFEARELLCDVEWSKIITTI